MRVEGVAPELQTPGEGDPTSVAADVATAIDAALAAQVLVVGSPPPSGRDLDLLAQPDDYATIRGWLDRAGFVPWGHTWARLSEPGAYAVELSTTERWSASRVDVSCLFADSEPIPGFRQLVRPGPAAALLLAARGTVIRRGGISDKVRGKVSQALARDPGAWTVAEARARDLGMVGSLRLLREAYQADAPLPARARAVGLFRVLVNEGPLGARARSFMSALPQRVKPAVISFSGLDGSGKSTQVSQLRDCLERLGVGSQTQWAGFKGGRQLRTALPFLDRAPEGHPAGPRDRLVPTGLRHSPLGQQLWLFVVVGLNTAHLWRHVLLRRRGSKVLIFDRFSPDTMVKLELLFDRSRGIDSRWQRRLFTLVSPKPDVGFLVDVSSEVAYGRRQDQTPEELATMSELYQDQVARYRLHRLDGTEVADVLAKQVAAAAWRGLR